MRDTPGAMRDTTGAAARGGTLRGMGEEANLVRPPVPALAPFVAAIGYYQGRHGHTRERSLATGGTQLLVNLAADEMWWHPAGEPAPLTTRGAAWQGPGTRPALIDPAHQQEIIWVAFRPGGAYPFLPAPASAVRDQLVPLDELWGRDGATLRDRLLSAGPPARQLRAIEEALRGRVAGSPESDPPVAAAAAALDRGATVAEVGDRLGWTRRRLARRFEERVGITPKRYARVRRFQRLLGAVTAGDRYGREPDWARLAREHGYHDQAHMIHDFRAFAGLSPTAYRPRSAAARNHIPV